MFLDDNRMNMDNSENSIGGHQITCKNITEGCPESDVQLVFGNIPGELKVLTRWVLSKSKQPYMAEAINSRASVTDPTTWSSFQSAQTAFAEGGYDGIGFVFNGDGIVGIDLDDCVVDGSPTEQAIEILDEIGCSYIEVSQSGRGLHGYGFHNGPGADGRRGYYKGVKIEIYCWKRFFVVTGNLWRQGALQLLKGFMTVYDQIERCNASSTIEDIKAIASVSSFSSASSVSSVQIPSSCIPRQAGQRHDCIFELARHLKALIPSATDEDLKTILKKWWGHAEPNVRTKDFDDSLIDFQYAWENVKFPKGALMKGIFSQMPHEPPENPGSFLGLDGCRLYHLILLLDRSQQEAFGNDVFMLSSRAAGDVLNIPFQKVSKILSIFVKKRFIEVVQRHTLTKATRYRLCRPGSQCKGLNL
jgi:hypothetical protein